MYDNPSKNLSTSENADEIILYQPDSTLSLDVRVENDTVWLNRNQIATLFDRDVKTIGKHISNALKEELADAATVAKFAIVQTEGNRTVTRTIEFYNLDVIISVGYRVKSKRGVQFRQWANKILKDYLLRGYSVNQRLQYLESRIDHRLAEHDSQIKELSGKVDFFLRTSLPPNEGVLFDGQIFDAHALIARLIRRADKRIVVIDNYIDDTVLIQLSKRKPGVSVDIFDGRISPQLQLDADRHNRQYPGLVLHKCDKAHDRFLIIDDDVYHIEASLKDLGKKIFAFSKMSILTADELLKRL